MRSSSLSEKRKVGAKRSPVTAGAAGRVLVGAGRALCDELALAASLLLWPPLWLLLALALLGLLLAYQVPHSYAIDVGSPQDQAYVRNFHTRLQEGPQTYRWSDVYGYVAFPGMGGSRPFTVALALDPERRADVAIV